MTSTEQLAAFERKLAISGSEAELLKAAGQILMSEVDGNVRTKLGTFLAAHAWSDAAMLLYRAALPGHGFQFGLPPPLPNGAAQAVATSWRRGDASAMPWRGRTPALALLRATVGESLRVREANALAACPVCRGLGWFVTAENRRQMCRHGTG